MEDILYIDISKDWIYDKSKPRYLKCDCKNLNKVENCFCPRCKRMRSRYCSICGTRKCVSCKRTFCQYCGQNMNENTESNEMCLRCGMRPSYQLKDFCIDDWTIKDPDSGNQYEVSDNKIIFKKCNIEFSEDEFLIFLEFVKNYVRKSDIVFKYDVGD